MLRFLDGPLATKEVLIKTWQELMFPKQSERKVLTVKYFAERDDHKLPPRSLQQARQVWTEHNVTGDAAQLLEREFNVTDHLSKVDSVERNKLSEKGGWFPTKQHLKLEDPEKSAFRST